MGKGSRGSGMKTSTFASEAEKERARLVGLARVCGMSADKCAARRPSIQHPESGN